MRKKLVFIVNHATFFVSHRLPIAERALINGYDVDLIVGHEASVIMSKDSLDILKDKKINIHRVNFRPSWNKIFFDIVGIFQIIQILYKLKPDVIHAASPKGNLYGGLAVKITNIAPIVFSISGMGYLFTYENYYSPIRFFVKQLFRFVLSYKRKKVIVQNSEDYLDMIDNYNVSYVDIVKLPGSGVNLDDFKDHSIDKKRQIVLFPARLIREKGILEFVNAAKILKKKYHNWKFILAGTTDYKSPSSIKTLDIKDLKEDGSVEIYGHVKNINKLFKKSSIVCLPSYREGMPKCLLEAAASGCAVVTSDATGCKESIIDKITGEIVPVKNIDLLIKKLEYLIQNDNVRLSYGESAKKLAISQFDVDIITKKILELYIEIVD